VLKTSARAKRPPRHDAGSRARLSTNNELALPILLEIHSAEKWRPTTNSDPRGARPSMLASMPGSFSGSTVRITYSIAMPMTPRAAQVTKLGSGSVRNKLSITVRCS
jgi:hypothetical protein